MVIAADKTLPLFVYSQLWYKPNRNVMKDTEEQITTVCDLGSIDLEFEPLP